MGAWPNSFQIILLSWTFEFEFWGGIGLKIKKNIIDSLKW